MINVNDVTLAILAGGRGVRMGAPKSGLVIGGKPILEYLLERFAWRGPTMLVSGIGNEQPIGCERFDLEVTDAIADQGPLRGVLTALVHARTELLAVVTVDMPAVTSEMVEQLIEKVRGDEKTMGAMFSRIINGEVQIEPFPIVVRREMRDVIARRIKTERRSVNGLCNEGVKVVSALDRWGGEVWRNLNFPSDLEGV